MTVGASLFLIAVGAILRFAVTDSISGVNLATIGLILIIVGVVGLLIGLFMYANTRRTAYREPGYRDRYVDRDPML
jgi:uncharacterized membrane protein YidH (DUF202 family)